MSNQDSSKSLAEGWGDYQQNIKAAMTIPEDGDSPVRVAPKPTDDPVQDTNITQVQPLYFDKLPIDDPEYTPDDAAELGRAAQLLLKDVPRETAKWFWQQLTRLRGKVEDLSFDGAEVESADDMMRKNDTANSTSIASEQFIRRLVKHAINEAGPTRDIDDITPDELAAADVTGDDTSIDLEELPSLTAPAKYGRHYSTGGKVPPRGDANLALGKEDYALLQRLAKQVPDDEIDPADVVAHEDDEDQLAGMMPKPGETKIRPKAKRKNLTAGEDGMTLDQLTSEFTPDANYGTAIGNEWYKIRIKKEYLIWLDDNWPQEYRDMLEETALEYIDAMREAMEEEGGLSPADEKFLDALEDDTEQIYDTPNFRDFLGDIVKHKMANDGRFHEYITKAGALKADFFAAGHRDKAGSGVGVPYDAADYTRDGNKLMPKERRIGKQERKAEERWEAEEAEAAAKEAARAAKQAERLKQAQAKKK